MGRIVLAAALVLTVSTACGPVRAPAAPAAATCASGPAPSAGSPQRPAAVTDAAKAFLGTLDTDQQAAAGGGLRLESLSNVQRAAALGVLKAGLSDESYQQVLDATGTALGAYRIRLSGTPAAAGPWSVRFDGPGLALDLTVADAAVSVSPAALDGSGTAPACGG
ncbi:DUF3500 domain-containing protein [Dactylosporangium matsuzakiense]|uniref:Lipoprotein n=1 Tax=Dactylosporangium matsuzakiense TaxID=53360 RepID=A0A9W6NL95_9ACTN|nr:DUF3500 domain-containing protein [Dactylosporangium matsuzakiense]UWZ48775.1 DUF3500 domain-containing protein [Dactylosporangium matsuzakiense]GLL01124.1 hypothetical protein GCM10017581_028650 [Dactylosporangium matsuzakiense]